MLSDKDYFIWINGGMWIRNDRFKRDEASLDDCIWQGMKKGDDGYPCGK